MTAEEFATKHGGDYVELIDGEVVPIRLAGARNGFICANVAAAFGDAVRHTREWIACSNDTFVLTRRNPDRVRGADFVLWRRELIPRPYPDLIAVPPELVVEVHRPFDTVADVSEKANEYLEAGVRVVLVVYPDSETIDVLRPTGVTQKFEKDDELALWDVLPGFGVPVRRFFE